MSASRRPFGCRLVLAAIAAALAGCGASRPPPATTPPAPRISPVTSVLPPPPAPSPPPPVATAFPIPGPTLRPPDRLPAPPRVEVVAEIPEPPADAPALAARFPEPTASFDTPAFAPGRRAFTSDDELLSILRGLAQQGARPGAATQIHLSEIGTSQAGRPIVAIGFTRPAPVSQIVAPATPLRRPAVVLIAGQHGDEPAGSEALLVVARELAAGRHAEALDKLDIVLVPRANPDGAAALRRSTEDGSDLDRDHLALATPEAAALATLLRDVAPLVVVDLHEYPVGGAFESKFAAAQRFDAQLQLATVGNLPSFVAKAAEEWFRVPLVAALRDAGLSSEWAHATSADPADRKVSMAGAAPQIGRNAFGLRNAVSIVVETRGGRLGRAYLKRRVQAGVVAASSVLASAAARAADLARLRQFVEREVASLACQGEAVLESALTPSEYALTMLDPQTGEIRRVAVQWDSALELRVVRSRPRPCGYWLAAGQGEAVRRLRLLGVQVQLLEEAGEVRGETYRDLVRDATAGGATPRLRVQTAPALLDVPAGGYYVSLEQPLANLAIAALEPESPASFVAARVVDGVSGIARVLARPAMGMVPAP